jgi:hypothetical protein
MTCRGYDPKSVLVSKTVKRRAARITDNHKRGAFIKSFVKILEEQRFSSKRTKE